MAVGFQKIMLPLQEVSFSARACPLPWRIQTEVSSWIPGRSLQPRISALSSGDGSSINKNAAAPNSNYVVPLDKASCITRPLAELFRDLNKRIPDNIIKSQDVNSTFIPWYQGNRMQSFYAPGAAAHLLTIRVENIQHILHA